MEQPRAVLDACVLYPAPLRDFLMECAVTGFYQPYWSNEIHNEWISNLLENRPDLSLARLTRTRDLMQRAMPQALVSGYEHLIETLFGIFPRRRWPSTALPRSTPITF